MLAARESKLLRAHRVVRLQIRIRGKRMMQASCWPLVSWGVAIRRQRDLVQLCIMTQLHKISDGSEIRELQTIACVFLESWEKCRKWSMTQPANSHEPARGRGNQTNSCGHHLVFLCVHVYVYIYICVCVSFAIAIGIAPHECSSLFASL